MIAYNKEWLRLLYARGQYTDAYAEGYLSAEQYKTLYNGTGTGLYTPNIFIRIGMGLLTVVITVFGIALLGLLSGFDFDSIAGFLIFYALLCYGALELIVNTKRHYNSGVDNVLLFFTMILFVSGVRSGFNAHSAAGDLLASGLSVMYCSYLAYRFADAMAAAFAVLSGVVFVLFLLHLFLPTAALFPAAMLLCWAIYTWCTRLLAAASRPVYDFVLRGIALTALVLLYLSGNVYTVDVFSNELIGDAPLVTAGNTLTRAFYWAWTLAVPAVYILAGVRRKNIVLIRTGVIFLAVAVITFRAYHSLLSAEVAMILGGSLLLLTSTVLIRLLRQPQKGFTFAETPKAPAELNVEDLLTEKIITRATQ
ncbi:MAG: hypothetical protein JNL72_01480 [Flavipsychrobacter sp.]|nr:hypothetical protein [Flavipsychrobacter sp.]